MSVGANNSKSIGAVGVPDDGMIMPAVIIVPTGIANDNAEFAVVKIEIDTVLMTIDLTGQKVC